MKRARALAVAAGFLATVLVFGLTGAAGADSFTLTVVAQTNSTITFSYPAQQGYGYLYSANGVLVSRTNDASRTQVKFAKNTANSYEVASIVKGTTGSCCVTPPPPPPPPPAGTISQTVTAGSMLSGTVNWRAVYDANGDGVEDDPGSVRFIVDGAAVLTETTPPFGDTAGFWDSSTVSNAAHSFKVDALNDSGAVVASNTVSATVNNATPPPPPPSGDFPNDANTGTPAGVTLHSCASTITVSGTYDLCQFSSLDVRASNVHVTRSRVNGMVRESGQTGLVISDTTIACGCLSQSDTSTPTAVLGDNFTLLRVNLSGSGHGVAVGSNVLIQDTYIHGLGGNTQAHKDGIYSGDGDHVTLRHNNIECNDGPAAGCTSAIGILTDFGTEHDWVIDGNLLNTIGSYCFYAAGGPSKPFGSYNITFINNHFGRKFRANCGFYGPVTYWDSSKPGMVWSNNVWDDTGQIVPPAN